MACKFSNYFAADCSFEDLEKKNLNSFIVLCAAGDPLIKDGMQRRLNYLHRKLAQNLWGSVIYDRDRHVAGFLDALPIEYSPQGIEGQDLYVIQCITVRDDLQGQGLGRKLIEDAVVRSKDRSGLAVIAYEDPEQKPAAFFRAVGFKELRQIGPLRLLWYPHKTCPEPTLSWRKNKSPDVMEVQSQPTKVELVAGESCPYAFRTSRIITKLLDKTNVKLQFMVRRPEEKPLWRRLDLLPALYVDNQLKSIWALNEDEAKTLLINVFPELVLSKKETKTIHSRNNINRIDHKPK